MRGPSGLLGILVLSLSVAGCASQDPPALVKDFAAVPENAGHEVGNGDFDIRIRVVAEHGDGAPVPLAPVLVYPIPKPITPPTVDQLRRGNATYAGRTDPTGEMVAHLDPGKTYTFLTTTGNHTVEARHLVRMDPKYATQPLVIVLYNATKNVSLQGKFPATPTVTKVPGANVCCVYGKAVLSKHDVHFDEDPAANVQYTSRLSGVAARVQWDSVEDGFADLGIRVGFSEFVYWESDVAATTPGPSMEERRVDHANLREGTQRREPKFWAAAMTRSPIVTATGVDYTITVEAQFSTDPVTPRFLRPYPETPGFEGAFAVLGLLAVGLVLRRR